MFHWLNRLIGAQYFQTAPLQLFTASELTAKFVVVDEERFIRSKYGVYLKTRWTDATFHFCVLGIYGKGLSEYLSSQQQPFSFIDIGANQGLYSLLAARNNFCQQVFAFEPVSENYQYLTNNLRVNDASSKTLAFRAAIAENHGPYQICLKRGHSGAASMRPQLATKSQRYETIQGINAADLHNLFKFIERAIIKIDVEGFEKTVIDELVKSGVLTRTQAVFYEVDERWSQPQRIRQQLIKQGFKSFKKFGSGYHYDVLATREQI
ncbi:MAG TPA: FkbM family methyltransferase [Methylophaga sp.]|nr:FkbM family methyltransferase [Methylophaga sp.]